MQESKHINDIPSVTNSANASPSRVSTPIPNISSSTRTPTPSRNITLNLSTPNGNTNTNTNTNTNSRSGIKSLDRSGKPSRKWEVSSLPIKSFTGYTIELPRWTRVFNPDLDKLQSNQKNIDEQKKNTNGKSETVKVSKDNHDLSSNNNDNQLKTETQEPVLKVTLRCAPPKE